MHRTFACWPALLLAVALSATAFAATVTVPDDYPTIQSAIDLSTAEVIELRDGDYGEHLVLGRSVAIRAAAPLDAFGRTGFPSVLSVTIQALHPDFTGLRFRGPVIAPGGYVDARFQACTFDSGFTTPWATANILRIVGCQVRGGIRASGSAVNILGSTFLGGNVWVSSEGDCNIRGNTFLGPGEFGLKVAADFASGFVSENTIEGVVDGLVLVPYSGLYPAITRNDIRGCPGAGIRIVGSGSGGVDLVSNRLRGCGAGIESDGGFDRLTATANSLDSLAGAGIRVTRGSILQLFDNDIRHAEGDGIDLSEITTGWSTVLIRGNHVIACDGAGIRARGWALVDSNVVGRCGGDGFVLAPSEDGRVSFNTAYRNSGSGFVLSRGTTDLVRSNIAYRNDGYGLTVASGSSFTLGCNDWYGNLQGVTSGMPPGATDLAVEPLFCDWAHDDVHLSGVSALADVPGCGRVGALGVGCPYPSLVGVPAERVPSLVQLAVAPSPSAGSVRFTWGRSAPGLTLAVFDASGARRWSGRLPEGATQYTWQGTDDLGRALPSGVYFARVLGSTSTTRVVLVR